MTNGEKIMQAFPDLQIDMGELEVYMWTTTHDAIDIPLEWWNAEYKEPTTKNCRTCRNQGSHNGVCDICKKYSCWTEIEPTKNDLGVDAISRADACSLLMQVNKILVNSNSWLENTHEPLNMAFDMAIKALEHPEKNVIAVVPCGDAVSRNAVINQIFYSTDNNGDVVLGSALRERIARLPSVTPQEKKGHWIPVFQGDEIIDYRCSCCEFGNTFGKGTVGMNYCPRCGSRNEVEQ